MAIAEVVRQRTRTHPRAVTTALSVVGYVVVLAAFAGLVPVPPLSDQTTHLFSHLIAVVNTLALASILAGWWFVRRGQVRRHRTAMLTAFGLIVAFLVLYVWKQSGGFTKSLVVPAGAPLATDAWLVSGAYHAMLAIHVILSIVAVPVVLYAVVLGLTHSIRELPGTAHPRVGRWAAAAWSVSLALGILTYLLLNHVYDWEKAALLIAAARPLRVDGRPGDGPDGS